MFTHQVLVRPQVHLLHQGSGEVVTQGDNAEGELREGAEGNCQVRKCIESLEGSGRNQEPISAPCAHPSTLTHLPPPADILLLEVLQIDCRLPAYQGLLAVHRLGDKAESMVADTGLQTAAKPLTNCHPQPGPGTCLLDTTHRRTSH